MKTFTMIIFSVAVILFTGCKKEIQKPDVSKNNFPQTMGKSVYIVMKKTSKETRNNDEIVKFINKRLEGAGMNAKINAKDSHFYITIPAKNVPNTLQNVLKGDSSKAKKYFKNMLEQKIEITLQLVDTDFMATLPPGIVINGGHHFGKVIKGIYKNQVRLQPYEQLYPIMRKGKIAYMAIRKKVLVHGGHILKAGVEKVKGKPWIHIKFTQGGAYRFSNYTRRYIQERLAVLVNGWVLAAPTISEHIPDGETWIAGKMTQERAFQLAAYFNASGGFGVTLVKIEYR